MSSRPRIVVIGSCIVDLTMTVSKLPEVGETIMASKLTVALGGNGANYAVGVARLGGSATLVTAIGEDHFGDAFMKVFTAEGVDCRHVRRTGSQPTGMGIPMVLPDGSNGIVAASGAALEVSPDDVERAAGDIRHADAVLIHLELQPNTVLAAAAIARAAHVPIYLDPVPISRINETIVKSCDVLLPNEAEVAELTGIPVVTCDQALEAADQLQRASGSAVIVTLGAAGAAASTASYRGVLPGLVVDAIDTVGAGDAFAAGLLMSRCRGDGWSTAIRFANACGAASSTVRGAVPSMPSLRAVSGLIGRVLPA